MILNTPLKHPNTLTEAERLALPDPCRPMDSPVMPASRPIQQLSGVDVSPQITPSTDPQVDIESKDFTKTFNMDKFIQQQQQKAQSIQKNNGFGLGLSYLPKLVEKANKAWWQRLFNQYLAHSQSIPSAHTQSKIDMQAFEKRWFVLGQNYKIMFCILLLVQCKPRKTLNPRITLQHLTHAINSYANTHATELAFLTPQTQLTVEPIHVEMASIAIGWQVSKQADINQRTTTISSNNLLFSS